MLVTDIVAIVGLLSFCFVWTLRRFPLRNKLLWLAALAVVVAGFVGRWHGQLALYLAGLFIAVLIIKWLRGGNTTWPVRPFSGLVFLLLSVAAVAPFVTFPVPKLPAPSGENAVGVRNFSLVDEVRKGTLEADANQPRVLSVRVWYPASPSETGSPVAYASPEEAIKTIGYMSSMTGGPAELFSQTAYGNTHAYRNAPIIPARGLPVVYFSHGYTMYNWQNTVLMEALASRGYIVFSVAHGYDGGTVILDNGQEIAPKANMVEAMKLADGLPDYSQRELGGENWSVRHSAKLEGMIKARQSGDRLITESAPVWLEDRLFVSESLAAGKAPGAIADLIASADFERVGHMGMSFGGSVSGAICYVDPRCGAVVNLDGGDFHQLGINADIPVPMLMLAQDNEYMDAMLPDGNKNPALGYNDLSYEPYQSAGSRKDIYRFNFPQVGHLGFTDVGLYSGPPMSSAMVGTQDPQRINQVLNDLVVGFFDKHLRNETNEFPQKQLTQWADFVIPHSVTSVSDWWNSLGAEEQRARIAEEEAAFAIRDSGYKEVLERFGLN